VNSSKRYLKIFVSVFFLFVSLPGAGQEKPVEEMIEEPAETVLVSTFGGRAWDQCLGGAADSDGNIISTGRFQSLVDFDPGEEEVVLPGIGQFIQKIDSNGVFLWATVFHGHVVGTDVEVDLAGNIYATGHFWLDVDFDPAASTENRASNGQGDVFVVKLDPDGNLVWAQTFGGAGDDSATKIALDELGRVVVAGYFGGDMEEAPGVSSELLTHNGGRDGFVSLFDSDGNFLWSAALGDVLDDEVLDVAVDSYGNIYSIGSYRGPVDFDPGPDEEIRKGPGYENIFVQKLLADGQFGWVSTYSAGSGTSIAVGPDDSIFATGYFSGTVDFDPGPGTLNLNDDDASLTTFVQKLTSGGELIWARKFGFIEPPAPRPGIPYPTPDPEPHEITSTSIDVDAFGSVYIVGAFNYKADFDPGDGVFLLGDGGQYDDLFLCKLDGDGIFLWAGAIENIREVNEILIKPSDLLTVFGTYRDGTDFEVGDGDALPSIGGYGDCFVVQIAGVTALRREGGRDGRCLITHWSAGSGGEDAYPAIRSFRDSSMLTNAPGALFANVYYRGSAMLMSSARFHIKAPYIPVTGLALFLLLSTIAALITYIQTRKSRA